MPVKTEVWVLAQNYWRQFQQPDGSWAYTPDAQNPTGEHDLRRALEPHHHRA